MKTLKTWVAAAAMAALSSAACATPVFQGRLADGSASDTCTVSGATKCAMFYNTTLDITILNDWNIGRGSVTDMSNTARARANAAGAAQTDFTGWTLPTGDGDQLPGAQNQFLSIWNDVGGTEAALQAQFDGVLPFEIYWSDSLYTLQSPLFPRDAWAFYSDGQQRVLPRDFAVSLVAVRAGDVAAAVPEPQSLALALLALGATAVARRRRPR